LKLVTFADSILTIYANFPKYKRVQQFMQNMDVLHILTNLLEAVKKRGRRCIRI